MNDPFSLENKIVIVTGASSGIGMQTAIDCASMGATVVLIGRNEERLKLTLSMMENPNSHYIKAVDLNNISDYNSLIKDIVENCGQISGLVNCAGISSVTPLKIINESSLSDMVHINTYVPIFLSKEIVKMGNYDKNGLSIIFLSSIMGVVGESAKTMYSISKGALQSAARSMAVELSKKRIRVNCIAPGAIETPINAKQPYMANPEVRAIYEAQYPLGFGTTKDISYACIYLLSNASRWITGQTIVIDGGFTIK